MSEQMNRETRGAPVARAAGAPGRRSAWQPKRRREGGPRYPGKSRDRVLAVMSPVLALLLWEAAVRVGLLDARFFPPPSATAVRLVELVASGELWEAVSISAWRIGVGFLAGAAPGILIGLTMGLFAWVRAILNPVVAALYPIPKLALLPLIMLVFGLGELSKVVTIALGVFFPVLINTVAGVVGIERIYLDVARNFGAGRKDYYLTIALPGALPMIWTGLKLGAGVALLLIVAAEMIAASAGIGYMIWTGYAIFDLEQMFVGFIVMAVMGYLSSTLLDELERWIIPWKH